MDEQLKIGDVVKLNSGGPEMTVSKLSVGALLKPNEEAGVVCSWFDSHGQLSNSTFLIATLTKKPNK